MDYSLLGEVENVGDINLQMTTIPNIESLFMQLPDDNFRAWGAAGIASTILENHLPVSLQHFLG